MAEHISSLPADGVARLGDREVHLITQPGGTRPVVLLGGCGVPSYAWDPVVELLPEAWLVRMDRPGLIATPWPGRLPTLAEECATLIDLAVTLAAPVVLVAHSMAGPHAEALVRRRPELVCGLVLVDSSVEWGTAGRPRRGGVGLGLARAVDRLPTVGPVGGLVGRAAVAFASGRGWRGPGADAFADVYRRHESVASVIAENAAYATQLHDLAELRTQRAVWPGQPTVVLTAAGDGGKSWVADQRRLAELLGGRQVVVDDSRHLMMLDRPDVIAEAINALSKDDDAR